eukprot:11265484-Ditylum_brightwellii.AAC.1
MQQRQNMMNILPEFNLIGNAEDKTLETSESTRAAKEELMAECCLVSLSSKKTDRLQSKYDGLLREMETMQCLAGVAAKETDEKIKICKR